jgi:glycosyltransferase involved in cell wall biosynthesis
MTMHITIAVCTHNRADVLPIALRSLFALQRPEGTDLEIVLVDDGSTDHTPSVAQTLRDEAPFPMRYIPQPGTGVAAARNRCVAEANGDWIAFCDDDQRASHQWLNALCAIAHEKNARCVGGPILLDIPQDTLRRLGPVRRSLLGEHNFGPSPRTFPGKEIPSSGNLFIEKKLYQSVGGCDPSLSSGEDADLIGRVRAAGNTIWSAPDAHMYHLIPPHRLEEAYFRWVSHRWGANFARMDHKRGGAPRVILAATLRLLQGTLIHLPRLLLARLAANVPATGDHRCMLWRMEGYLRASLWLCCGRLSGQAAFMDRLEFRAERTQLATSPTPHP